MMSPQNGTNYLKFPTFWCLTRVAIFKVDKNTFCGAVGAASCVNAFGGALELFWECYACAHGIVTSKWKQLEWLALELSFSSSPVCQSVYSLPLYINFSLHIQSRLIRKGSLLRLLLILYYIHCYTIHYVKGLDPWQRHTCSRSRFYKTSLKTFIGKWANHYE